MATSTTTTTTTHALITTTPAVVNTANRLTIPLQTVGELYTYIKEDFDLDKARSRVTSLYNTSLEWVLQTRREQGLLDATNRSNPMPIALKLITILCAEEIQLESEFLYDIAKTCRLFTECFVSQAIQNKSAIYQETKNTFLQGFQKILGIIPHRQVALRYELQCAHAILNVLPTDQYFFEPYFSGIGEAIANASVSDAIKVLSQAKDDVDGYRNKKNWAYKVLDLSWTSHALIQETKLKERSQLLGQFYDGLKEYRETPKVAFCAVEGLAALAHQAKDYKLLFIQGSNSEPGLLTFIALQSEPKKDDLKHRVTKAAEKLGRKLNKAVKKDDVPPTTLSRAADPFWKVRYRALSHLYRLFPDLNDDQKKVVMEGFASRIPLEKDPLVADWLKQAHKSLSNDPAWTSLVKQKKGGLNQAIQSTTSDLFEKKKIGKESRSTGSDSEDDSLQAGGSEYTKIARPVLSAEDQELHRWEIQLLNLKLQTEKELFNYFYSEK